MCVLYSYAELPRMYGWNNNLLYRTGQEVLHNTTPPPPPPPHVASPYSRKRSLAMKGKLSFKSFIACLFYFSMATKKNKYNLLASYLLHFTSLWHMKASSLLESIKHFNISASALSTLCSTVSDHNLVEFISA